MNTDSVPGTQRMHISSSKVDWVNCGLGPGGVSMPFSEEVLIGGSGLDDITDLVTSLSGLGNLRKEGNRDSNIKGCLGILGM